MSHPLWTLAEVLAATGGHLDLPSKKTGGPEGIPPARCGAGPADREAVISGVSIDTRSLTLGDLFVPLIDVRDGHDFVTAAFERGATAALVRDGYQRMPGDGALIRVHDTLAALGRLGVAARARLAPSAHVIAVTGSAGKTGTKEMLRACLKVCASSPDKVHAPEKSFNNHWGVPLTLARMPADTEFAVFEIGMNHAGEIRPLVKMVRPEIAIVTNVLPVHVGNFPDGEIGVANAKAEIFEGLEAPREVTPRRSSFVQGESHSTSDSSPLPLMGRGGGWGDNANSRPEIIPPPLTPPRKGEGDKAEQVMLMRGTAIILRDNPHYERLRAAAQTRGAAVVTFGRDPDARVRLSALEIGTSARQADVGVAVRLRRPRTNAVKEIEFDIGMFGRHLATNALAVIAALDVLGCDIDRATRELALVKSAAGRGAREFVGASGAEILLLDESYNANPASMAAALATLSQIQDPAIKAKIAVLGDMLELGADSVRYHLGLKDAAARADLVFCCGPHMKHLFDSLPAEKQGRYAPTSGELIPFVLEALGPGDAVMVKGSLGSRMAPIVDAIKKRFAGV